MKATELMMMSRNADDAIQRADAENPSIVQDWGSEATLYRFSDGSVLAVSGSQVNDYVSADQARADYPDANL